MYIVSLCTHLIVSQDFYSAHAENKIAGTSLVYSQALVVNRENDYVDWLQVPTGGGLFHPFEHISVTSKIYGSNCSINHVDLEILARSGVERFRDGAI